MSDKTTITLRVMTEKDGDATMELSAAEALERVRTEMGKGKWCYLDYEYVADPFENVSDFINRMNQAEEVQLMMGLQGGQ